VKVEVRFNGDSEQLPDFLGPNGFTRLPAYNKGELEINEQN
jgi:hypothetical protein